MSKNVIEFPGKKSDEESQKNDELEVSTEEWVCKACNHSVDEKSEVKVLPINVGGHPQTGVPGVTFYVCPNCYTLSLPPEVFKEIHRRMNSRIIT